MGEKKAVVAVEAVVQEQEGERKEVVDMLAAQKLATSEGGFKDSAEDWSLARMSCASPQIRISATRASRVQSLGRATLGRSPKDLAKPYFDRKYSSVQTRQYLLGGLAADPGH